MVESVLATIEEMVAALKRVIEIVKDFFESLLG